MIKQKKPYTNILYLFVLYISNYIFPILLIPILINKLGVSSYGVIAGYIGVFQIVNMILDFGFSVSITGKISKYQNNIKYISKLNGSVFFIKLVLIVPTYFLLLIIFDKNNIEYSWMSIFICLIGTSFFPIWFFMGIEKMKYITIFTIASKVIYFMVSLFFLYYIKNIDYSLIILIYSITVFFCSFFSIFYVYKEGYKINYPGISFIKNEFLSALPYFWSKLSSSVYTSSGVSLLVIFSTSIQVSYFSLVEQAYKAGKGVAGPVIQAMYPYIVRTKNIRLYFKLFILSTLFVFLGCSFVFYFSDNILYLLFNVDNRIVSISLKVMAVAVLFSYIGMGMGMGYPVFSYIDKIHLANYSTHIGLLFFILGFICLYSSDYINVLGVSLVILLSEGAVMILRIFLWMKNR